MQDHAPNVLDLSHYWMPFTANRQFKQNPRLLVAAKDMQYTTEDGRKLLDAIAGMWCCNAGHGRKEITEAVQRQAAEMAFATPFQMGHPKTFELATRLAALTGHKFERFFFTNSGSESVDTALKIAIAYHHARGDRGRYKLIGRERAYHGVNFGGVSVGGIPNNRRVFGPLLSGIDHIRHTHDLARNAFSRGQPEHGAEFADDLERVIQLHDPSTVAAVIVEPVAGSTGVLVPPKGYLERLRAICDKYGVLLIFDEVITGFGRLGQPFAFDYFGITPDLVTVAKGLTNAAVPMGAVFLKKSIYDAFMTGPEHVVELFHGYTYSGHPLACAASLATLDIYASEGLLTRGGALAASFEEGLHSLKGLPYVIDIRNLGLMGAIEFEPLPGEPGKRGYEVFLAAYNKGLLVRAAGDVIALSPALIAEEKHLDEIFGLLRDVLKTLS